MSSRDPTVDAGAAVAPSASLATARPSAAPRSRYRRFVPLTTRWSDNDAYGHLNNVVYLSLFDSAVNSALVGAGLLDIAGGEVIGLVVETHCNFFASLAFPEPVEAGLAVSHVGASSIRYEIGIFAAGAPETAASGHFIHVYVDRGTRRPVPLPAGLLALAKELQ